MTQDLILHDGGIVPDVYSFDSNSGNLGWSALRTCKRVVQLTSAIITLLSAFAMEASTPTRSNSTVEGVKRCIEQTRFYSRQLSPALNTGRTNLTSLNFCKFHEWSSPG